MRKYLRIILSGIVLYCLFPAYATAHPGETLQSESLLNIISDMNRRYKVHFTYDREIVEKVRIRKRYNPGSYKNINEALSSVLRETNLKFQVLDMKYVIIYRDDPKGMESLERMIGVLQEIIDQKKREQQEQRPVQKGAGVSKLENLAVPEFRIDRSVEGKVLDEKGEGLPGVNIIVKGTQHGAVTDAEGRYKISVPDEKAVLIFSFVGYLSQETVVGSRISIDISLKTDEKSLEEVVVVGYGTQKKINLTGAVDVVSGDRLANRPANTVADLIKGASPNLNITMGMRGGEPGAASTWNIRGTGSIHGSGSPLVLVDGVEMNIQNVDPESIESVSVLKDASASAIYGSRAPFGVILITTKKGNRSEKVSIQYSNNLSFASPTKLPSYADALTWATAFNQANANAGLTPVYSEEQMNRIRQYMNGTFPYEYDPENPIDNVFAGRRNGNANNDWPRILIADYSFSQKHNLNVSGGNKKTQYYLSGGYINQNGMYEFGRDSYRRYNFMSNFSSKITNWLNFNSSLKYANGKTDFPVGQTTVGREHFFNEIIHFAPMMPFYNINGTIQSPLVRLSQGSGRDRTEINDFFITLGSELEPVKGWKTIFSYNYNTVGSRNATNPRPVLVELGTGQFGNIGKPASGYTASFSQNTYTLINATTSYELTANQHYFKPMFGFEQELRQFSGISATGTNLITDEIPSISTSLGDRTVNDQIYHWATRGFFGRLNYNYKEKYLLEFSARYNGSSRFARDSRWGFFPSASVGYNISQEPFWSYVEPYVNTLKVRGSYGALGNQNVANYLYLSTIPVGSELKWIVDRERPPFAKAPGLVSDDLTWEAITTLNLGIDAGFLKNRLSLTFDWFNRVSTDMLGPSITLPYLLGASTPQSNNAELSTKGFELLIGWEDRLSGSLSYDLKLGLGDSQSKILAYQNEKGLIDTWYAGKKVGEIWGFETDGLIQSPNESMPDQSKYHPKWGPGDMKYKDLNQDHVINDGLRTLGDHGDLVVIGNTSSRYNVSLSGGLKWKGLDFNMFWQGVGKKDYHPDLNSSLFWGMVPAWGGSGIYKNSLTLDYWRPADETNLLGPNTDAYFAKPYFTAETNKNRQRQSRYLLNAAYLRLRNLQIGYSIPERLLSKIAVQKARIYFSGENLLLFSKLPKILDPETAIASDPSNGGYLASGVIYPISRTLSFGINLSL